MAFASASWSSSAIVRGIGADHERDRHPDERHQSRGEPGDHERVEVEILPREQRPEDERTERRTEERPEEDVGDRARATLGRVHVGGGRPRQQDGAVHRADAHEAEDDEDGAVHGAAERGQRAADGTDDEPAGDHGHTADPVHQAPGREGRERSGGEEDRRPEAQDRLDAR